jgi:hypothetical protein
MRFPPSPLDFITYHEVDMTDEAVEKTSEQMIADLTAQLQHERDKAAALVEIKAADDALKATMPENLLSRSEIVAQAMLRVDVVANAGVRNGMPTDEIEDRIMAALQRMG